MKNMSSDKTTKIEALVVDKIPNGSYIVETIEPKIQMKAHVSGKMRQRRIRIFPGDKVLVELTSNDLTHGRIVYSLRKK